MYIANEKRYENASFAFCGKSGLALPRVSLGIWHNFGTYDDYENMKRMCFTAFDNGITHFDAANNYGPEPGSAETNFGKILKEELSAYRDQLIISTKAGYYMWEGPYGDGGSRKYMLASLDNSLKRLGVDYVDIFYHHRMTRETPLEESMSALTHAVKSGKALYVGLSNYDGKTLKKATEILEKDGTPFIINQNPYNILNRNVEENGLLDMSCKLGKGVICFSPLAQGLLTDRYLGGIPKGSRASKNHFLKEEQITPELTKKISALNSIAKERGQSLAQMSLAWVLKNPAVTSVLIGASSPQQILDNLKCTDSAGFTPEELSQIDSIVME
ncbi:MAG: L-glyceraldehyde 3-phosphate reductase [Ruminococcaceae bacterium]|nr:L-glyceraldehyde 3-phosphate reductase [Oscillospiraceae bacterium]